MWNNGIVKEKMWKNLYKWELNSIIIYNQISEETKCEILQVEKEILLAKIVKAIQTVRALRNLELIINI